MPKQKPQKIGALISQITMVITMANVTQQNDREAIISPFLPKNYVEFLESQGFSLVTVDNSRQRYELQDGTTKIVFKDWYFTVYVRTEGEAWGELFNAATPTSQERLAYLLAGYAVLELQTVNA